jgi:ankyrin repeat protein
MSSIKYKLLYTYNKPKAFYYACKNGLVDNASELFKLGNWPDHIGYISNKTKNTPLMLCITNPLLNNIFDRIISHATCLPDQINTQGLDALLIACINKKFSHAFKIATLLKNISFYHIFERTYNNITNKADPDGITSLFIAISHLSLPCAEYVATLILSCIGITRCTDINKNTTLHLATSANNYNIVKSIIAAPDFDINAKNTDNKSALDIACAIQSGSLITTLVCHPRCNIIGFVINESKESLLEIVCRLKLLDAAEKIMIEYESSVLMMGLNECRKSLYHACKDINMETIAMRIINKNLVVPNGRLIDWTYYDTDGMNALMHCIGKRMISVAEKLIPLYTNTELRKTNNTGFNALDMCRSNGLYSVETLIKNRINPPQQSVVSISNNYNPVIRQQVTVPIYSELKKGYNVSSTSYKTQNKINKSNETTIIGSVGKYLGSWKQYLYGQSETEANVRDTDQEKELKELKDKLLKLEQENKKNKERIDELDVKPSCLICTDEIEDKYILNPCKHVLTIHGQCVSKLSTCPICRQRIGKSERIYITT